MSVLEISGVNKTFGGLRALDDVNLKIEEQTVHAVIGPNRAQTPSGARRSPDRAQTREHRRP